MRIFDTSLFCTKLVGDLRVPLLQIDFPESSRFYYWRQEEHQVLFRKFHFLNRNWLELKWIITMKPYHKNTQHLHTLTKYNRIIYNQSICYSMLSSIQSIRFKWIHHLLSKIKEFSKKVSTFPAIIETNSSTWKSIGWK